MGSRRRYVKKADTLVTAVRLDLDTDGFRYDKWGAEQQCKPGDWLLDNDGDVYTVDADVFERTYREVSPGRFMKDAPIWAEKVSEAGVVETLEGETHYEAGDYLVSNNEDGTDSYAITADKFEEMYELDD